MQARPLTCMGLDVGSDMTSPTCNKVCCLWCAHTLHTMPCRSIYIYLLWPAYDLLVGADLTAAFIIAHKSSCRW